MSLTPISGSVSISEQWNEVLFNVNNIADTLMAVGNTVTGWVSAFFSDLFNRSGNSPVIRPE